MTIVRYEPWALVNRLARHFDQALGEALTAASVSWIPHVDVHEETERFVVTADLPGVEGKDIEVTADKGVLTVTGERRAEKKSVHGRLRARRARVGHVPAPLHAARERGRRGDQGDARERGAGTEHSEAPAGAAAAHQRPGRLSDLGRTSRRCDERRRLLTFLGVPARPAAHPLG